LPVDVLVASIKQALPGDTAGLRISAFAGETLYSGHVVALWDPVNSFHFESPPTLMFQMARFGNATMASLADPASQARPNYSSSIFGVKRQPWGVVKKIDAAKHRESRTLGEVVGAELTCLRDARGWSQQKLAYQLGYTERYISKLERIVGTIWSQPTLGTQPARYWRRNELLRLSDS